MLEEQHREGEKSDWVWLPHTANSILGTLVRLRIGGALALACLVNLNRRDAVSTLAGLSQEIGQQIQERKPRRLARQLWKVLPTSSVTCIQK